MLTYFSVITTGVVVTRHDCLKLVKSADSAKKKLEILKWFDRFSDLPQLNWIEMSWQEYKQLKSTN